MNRVARTILNVVRIEVLLGIGLVMWVFSLEAQANLPASRLHKDYAGVWVVEDTSRKEMFVLRLMGGNYTDIVYTLAGRSNGYDGAPTRLKIRSTKDRQLLLTTRRGEIGLRGKLISPSEMSGIFSDGTTWTAKKAEDPESVEIWQLVKKNRRQCGGFLDRKYEATCEKTGGLGAEGAGYVQWTERTTFKFEAMCQAYANTYWAEVCPESK